MGWVGACGIQVFRPATAGKCGGLDLGHPVFRLDWIRTLRC